MSYVYFYAMFFEKIECLPKLFFFEPKVAVLRGRLEAARAARAAHVAAGGDLDTQTQVRGLLPQQSRPKKSKSLCSNVDAWCMVTVYEN